MTYDQKCHDLAMVFLGDFVTKNAHTGADHRDTLADALAGDIQQAIEDFIERRNLQELAGEAAMTVRTPLDRTPWFAPTVEPVRKGYYECAACVLNGNRRERHYWTGKNWAEDASLNAFAEFSPFEWRGLARKP